MEKLGQITFLGDRKVSMVEMDFGVDDETLDLIAAHAIHLIENDKPALFEYAMRKAIESFAKGEKSWTLQKAKKVLSKRSSRLSRSKKS